MKYKYDKEDDVLMIWISKEQVDFAEQNKNVIVHFSKKNKPVMLEILKASQFLKESSQAIPQQLREQVFSS